MGLRLPESGDSGWGSRCTCLCCCCCCCCCRWSCSFFTCSSFWVASILACCLFFWRICCTAGRDNGDAGEQGHTHKYVDLEGG